MSGVRHVSTKRQGAANADTSAAVIQELHFSAFPNVILSHLIAPNSTAVWEKQRHRFWQQRFATEHSVNLCNIIGSISFTTFGA